jgi:hypothetical protein
VRESSNSLDQQTTSPGQGAGSPPARRGDPRPDDVFEDLPDFPGSPVADLLSVDDAVFQVPSIFDADARQAV